jgi:hypothetical protein
VGAGLRPLALISGEQNLLLLLLLKKLPGHGNFFVNSQFICEFIERGIIRIEKIPRRLQFQVA